MRATMVPVTIGGISTSIQPVPATWLTTPMITRDAPTKTIPPSADD